MGPLEYPRYSYADLQQHAEGFLSRLHAAGRIPVPIEELVELQLELDIVPIPGLQQSFDVVGFTTGNLSAIYVDEYVYKNVEARYRFTLAHEVGHIVLHADLYRALHWDSVASWKRVMAEIPEEHYGWLEWHANTFAGLILVPDAGLENEIAKCEAVVDCVLVRGSAGAEAREDFVAECIAQRFAVSAEAAAKRISRWRRGREAR